MNLLTVDKIKKWYEELSNQSLESIDQLYTSDCFFKDPFNEFHGVERLKRVFSHMFKSLEHPQFIFIDMMQDKTQVFVTWDFVFKSSGREFRIHGSSHLKIIGEKIYYHRDYWDVGEELLQKVPIIKSFYSLLVRKLKVD